MKITQAKKPKKSANKIVKNRYTDPVTGKFVKGNPGGGRPAGTLSVVQAIKKKLAQYIEEDAKNRNLTAEQKRTYLDLLVNKIMIKGIKEGDVSMIRDIINRVDGMPKQATEHSGELVIKWKK